MARATSIGVWKTLLGFFTGSIIGAFVSDLTSNINGLSWLSFGRTVGISPPFSVNLGVLSFSLGATISVDLAIILFIIIFVLLFRKIF